MDLKAIKQVIDLMKRSELTEFEFEEEGFKLRLSRQSENPSAPIIQSITPASVPAAVPQASSCKQVKAAQSLRQTIQMLRSLNHRWSEPFIVLPHLRALIL